jgi:hypothetical protein
MSGYRYGMGGHAPGHVRNTFLQAVEAWQGWSARSPEPTVEFEVGYVPQPILISKACGLVWNCPDVLPDDAWKALVTEGLTPGRRTCGCGAGDVCRREGPIGVARRQAGKHLTGVLSRAAAARRELRRRPSLSRTSSRRTGMTTLLARHCQTKSPQRVSPC